MSELHCLALTPAAVVGELPVFSFRIGQVGNEPAFDVAALKRGPVVRFGLFRAAAQRHLLRISLPALAADEPALRLLTEEIALALAGGREPAGVQYADFAEWQNELLAEESAAERRQAWRAGRCLSPI